MLTKSIKAQSTTITSSRASICGADASPNIRHIGNWRDFQLKLPFVITDSQSMFFVVFYHIFTGQYVIWRDYFMQIPKICHNDLYKYVITFILGWMENGLIFIILYGSPEYAIGHKTIISILLCKYLFGVSNRNCDTDPVKLKLKREKNRCGHACRKLATKYVPIFSRY